MSEVLTEDGLDPALIISTVGEEQIVEGGQEIIIYPKSVAAQQQTEKEQEVSVIFPKSRAYYSKMSLVDLGKRLLDAAKRGETDEVRTLMSNGAPFTTDWLGTSPLHFASQYGHLETAEVLLRAGISRDARTKVDRTPLHVAAQEGHSEIVDLLVQHAADIEAKDMLKMTPLHWATEKGHSHVMENLIKHGADITCENKFDRTPLDIATANGRADLVQILQIASHTQIGNMTEGDTVTIETSEVEADGIETVTVTTTDTRSSDSEMKGGVIPVSVYPNFSNKDDKSTDQSNSSVLATLAALAEATAPNTSTQAVTGTSNTDAMSWLESQGITMITTTDGGMISSAVENGQSITLTEAGKIALTNIIKQQALQTEDESVVSHDPEVEEDLGTVPDDSESQKVITIVAEPQDPSDTDGTVIETITPESIVMGAGDASDSIDVNDEPPTKRQRTEDSQQAEDKDESLDGMDKEALRKQLEEIQKQAETYKLQLKQKEQEAEEYKKKLNESIGGSSETDEPAIE